MQGYQAVAELVQFFGGRKHLHGFLAAEESRNAFLFLYDGAHIDGTPRHFGQVVHQEAVSFVLFVYRVHDIPQMGFLICQQETQGVYLCRAHILPAMRFQGLQQAVGAQALNVVMVRICFVPTYNALTQQGKPGDVAVGGVDVAAYLPYLGGLGFYLPYPPRSYTKMAAMLIPMMSITIHPSTILICSSH